MTKIVSKNFNIHSARQFIESVNEEVSDNYYLCFGKHTPYEGSDSIIESPIDSLKYRTMQIYDDLIYGKKILPSDLSLMVTKKIWESGTIYDIYDDQQDLSTKSYYVATLDGANYNIYKCIFNNNNLESTVMPTTVDEAIFTESDGYSWKYLYTISSADWNKFKTTSYMPVYSNTDIVSSAVDRSIDLILTEYSGSYYNNYFEGIIETGTQIVNSSQFRLTGTAVALNDYYKGCIIEFTTSSGVEYKEIQSYTVSGSTRTIILATAVESVVTIGDTYRIFPKVVVLGDGNEVESCLAWAVIDSTSSNSVSQIEILQSGSGYRNVQASVYADPSVGVSDPAILRPIISPLGGHGSNPVSELLANKVCVSVKITGSESNTIIVDNDFRNVSIIKNPQFSELTLHYVGTSSIFNVGEEVYQYRPIQLVGSVTVDDSTVTGTGTLFDNSLESNDRVLIQNSTSTFLSTVQTVTNNTTLTIVDMPAANISSSNIFLLDIKSQGKVVSYLSNSVTVTEVSNTFTSGGLVIGGSSFSTITLTDVKNNSKPTNDLRFFQQAVSFTGVKTSAELFIADEYVYEQGIYDTEDLRPMGRLYHYIDDTTDSLYITNERNIFSSNATIIGNTSGAVFVATNKYNGDLIKDSGEVLYISNVEAVSKTNTSIEVIKFILDF